MLTASGSFWNESTVAVKFLRGLSYDTAVARAVLSNATYRLLTKRRGSRTLWQLGLLPCPPACYTESRLSGPL